jgi:hypothetical protein
MFKCFLNAPLNCTFQFLKRVRLGATMAKILLLNSMQVPGNMKSFQLICKDDAYSLY